MSLIKSMQKYGLSKMLKLIYKDPENNMLKVMDWADRFAGDEFMPQRRMIRSVIEDKDNPYHGYIYRILNEVNEAQGMAIAENFFFNASLAWAEKHDALEEKYGCNIPWAILLDPTSACNLHCTGCWAAEYGGSLNLSLEEIDGIIRQGKELGVYMYIYTGGEPLVRKDDIIKLCEMHSDCIFLSFTNGTLIDEAFADEMLRVKNFVPAISLEGNEETTDARRGEGVYKKVMRAMELLRERKLFFGISSCYTSVNYLSVTSEDYFDGIINMGAFFIWYFHYMPVGNDASVSLLPAPSQRKEVYRRVRKYRAEKQVFAMDFQNDAEFVGGCIAGGRAYLHINPGGDIEPCVFIHYSDSNIREKTLLDALRSPLFLEYRKGQPFNDNMLKPCPMLENPEKIKKMVEDTGARTTDLKSPEPVTHLISKTEPYAEQWTATAEELWEERQLERRRG